MLGSLDMSSGAPNKSKKYLITMNSMALIGLFLRKISKAGNVFIKFRNQNSLKNKFYGTLKNLLRSLFKEMGDSPGNKIRHLSANRITDIYDGRKGSYFKYLRVQKIQRNAERSFS